MELDYIIQILLQDKPSDWIKENESKVFDIIPELKVCKSFHQNSDWHIYDVYEHILHVIDGVPNNIILRMAALFHDIGKPLVYKEDEDGVGHFYGHWDKSKEIFEEFAIRFGLDDDLKKRISNLILYHDLNFDKVDDDEVEKIIEFLDRDDIMMLFQLKTSDLLAQNKKYHYLLDDYERQKERLLKLHLEKRRI